MPSITNILLLLQGRSTSACGRAGAIRIIFPLRSQLNTPVCCSDEKKEPARRPALIPLLLLSGCFFLAAVAAIGCCCVLVLANCKTLVELAHLFHYPAIFKLAHREHGRPRESLRANLRRFG
jgi:hypothetical protein